ncbi:bacterioferritin-associated ferredoxin [Nitrosomonas aestuarii]|uniref:bacterioferritin-associated ferredoxin n=1 Tax=Nitrosomonas aestuarii TaxID=52441 RepID=UPI000D31FC6B|nr:bacterioferritin-associated ferredoxin [Nitrosomonas aestuarii]PTN13069.1 bacterioferritin-associated ferredoxin [Nitrosomonas aestuarii]
MYICVCKGVTDSAIREAVNNGAERMRDLKTCLGVTEQCGICACHAKEILEQARAEKAQLHSSIPEITCLTTEQPEETDYERGYRYYSVA